MKRVVIVATAVVTVLLFGIFLFFLSLFSKNIGEIVQSEKEFTRNTARYIESYFQKEAFTVELSLDPSRPSLSSMELRNQWVKSFAKAAGFSDIIIADSLGLVLASTSDEFPTGSWILASKRDSAYVDSILFGASEVWAEQIDSAGTKSRFLYKTIHIDSEQHVLILGARQAILSEADAFRGKIVGTVIAFGIVLVTLFLLVNYYFRTASKAQQELLRHQKLAYLGQISAELAHELKNPLAIIRSSSDALTRNPKPEKQKLLLEFIAGETMKMSRLITNMLNLGKDSPVNLERFSPATELQPIIDPLKELYPETVIDCTISESEMITADRSLFRQISENILSNGAREAGSGGKVAVELFHDDRKVAIRFLDSGGGVPDQLKETLFDPFVSGSKNGTGLGLSIVRTCCEKMGWNIRHIDCDSDGWRTCFEIEIPHKGNEHGANTHS